jgi:hypothetical protein
MTLLWLIHAVSGTLRSITPKLAKAPNFHPQEKSERWLDPD